MIGLSRALLLAAVALPALTWTLNRFVLRRKLSWVLMVLITWGGCVVMTWGCLYALEAGLRANMMVFDLDRDGSISRSELTPDAKIAMAEWSSDTGRNLGTFLVVPLSGAWTGAMCCVLAAGNWAISRCLAQRRERRSAGRG